MSKYEVIFLDIDGTTLQPDGTIAESTKQAVFEVQQKGMEVFLATGRPSHEIQEVAKELNINSYIGYNGANGVYKGQDLFQEPMEPELISNFLKIAEEYLHEMVLYTDHLNTFTSLEVPKVKEFIEKIQLRNNALYSPHLHKNILGITVINVRTNEHLLYQKQGGIHLSQVNIDGIRNCYDVIRDKVNKGIGVKRVLEHLGIEKEKAIAFGDGMNDKEMLTNVGEGIAMGNSHPELFAYAKHKTKTVTESGIYYGLKMLGLID